MRAPAPALMLKLAVAVVADLSAPLPTGRGTLVQAIPEGSTRNASATLKRSRCTCPRACLPPLEPAERLEGYVAKVEDGSANGARLSKAVVFGNSRPSTQVAHTRTPAQKATLRTLIRTYQERYPGIVIRGHRDWPKVQKACPSFDVAAWIKEGMPA